MADGNIPCGVAIPQTFAASPIDLRLIREFVLRAEALGYDSLWVQEQIITGYSILEPVALLTYASALTSRVRLGTSVLLPVIRNPLQLAKSLATLDQLSQGRLTVGVGIGGPHIPEAAFGVSPERRARRFVETLEVMKALWTQPRATFNGEFWRFEKIPMEPKPVQQPHPPLWFGAREPVALKRAVRHGDGWMGAGSSSSADFVRQHQMLRRLLDEAGRDPASFCDLQARLSCRRRRPRSRGAALARVVWRPLSQRRHGRARVDLGQPCAMYRAVARTGTSQCAASAAQPGVRRTRPHRIAGARSSTASRPLSCIGVHAIQ